MRFPHCTAPAGDPGSGRTVCSGIAATTRRRFGAAETAAISSGRYLGLGVPWARSTQMARPPARRRPSACWPSVFSSLYCSAFGLWPCHPPNLRFSSLNQSEARLHWMITGIAHGLQSSQAFSIQNLYRANPTQAAKFGNHYADAIVDFLKNRAVWK